MQFTLGVLLGIVVGVVVLLAARSVSAKTGAAWMGVVLAAISAALFIAGFLQRTAFDFPGAAVITLGGSFAAAIIGIGGLIRKERIWQNWVAAILGGAPALFWIFFAFAEVLFPHS
ncbi:MAG: hypothetical protein ACYC6C_04915 [Coriobacteriia bacterium]